MKHRNRQRAITFAASRRLWIAALTALACVAFNVPAARAANLATDDTDPQSAQRELSRIAKVIKSLEKEMHAAKSDRTQASLALETHERALNDIVKKQRELKAASLVLKGQLKQLHSTHKELHSQVEHEHSTLAKDMRIAYVMGRSDRTQLVLQGRDPNSVARLLRYHSYFTRAQRVRIQHLEASITLLAQSSAAVNKETARLRIVDERYQSERNKREQQRGLRAQALRDLNAELARDQSTLATLQKDQKRLSALISRLRQAISDVPAEAGPPRSFKSLRGKLPWPVKGSLKRRFGSRRNDNEAALDGVLLASKMGRDVRAIAHGRVVFADWLRGFGLMVIVDHGKGYMSLYGHNESLHREPGEWIGAGDTLASVGDSGGKDGAGLYFEIRRDGKPQNPSRWCSSESKFPANS